MRAERRIDCVDFPLCPLYSLPGPPSLPAAFPHLSELQRKYKERGLRVVGVCLEDDVPSSRWVLPVMSLEGYCLDTARPKVAGEKPCTAQLQQSTEPHVPSILLPHRRCVEGQGARAGGTMPQP